jgi:rhodanese-related sulfurtransferase
MRIIDVHDLQQRLADGEVLLLDVRGDDEFSYAAIAGSVHIPLPDLPRRVDELNPARPIAVLCHHGMRSEMAA